MAAVAQLTFDARLEPAIRQFAETARKVQDVEGGVKKLTQETGKLGRELEKAGSAKAFDAMKKGAGGAGEALSGLAGKLTGLVAGYLSFGAAIEAASAALAKQNELANAAARAHEQLLPQYRAAAALPGRQGPAVAGAAQRIAEQSGLTREEAYRVANAAAREGMLGEADVLGRAQAAGGIDAAALADALGAMRDQFPSAGLNAGGFIEMLLEAQRRTGVGDVNELIGTLKQAAPSVRALGGSPEELLALMGAMGERAASKQARGAIVGGAQRLAQGVETQEPDTVVPVTDASGRVVNYKQIKGEKRQRGFGGGGLVEGVARFEREAPAEFAKAMQDTAFNDFVTMIRQAGPDLPAALAGIRGAAGGGGLLDQMVREAESMPGLRAVSQRNRSANRIAGRMQDRGVERLEYERLREELDVGRSEQLREAGFFRSIGLIIGQTIENVLLKQQETFYGPGAAAQGARGYLEELQTAGVALQGAAEALRSAAAAPQGLRSGAAAEADLREGRRR